MMIRYFAKCDLMLCYEVLWNCVRTIWDNPVIDRIWCFQRYRMLTGKCILLLLKYILLRGICIFYLQYDTSVSMTDTGFHVRWYRNTSSSDDVFMPFCCVSVCERYFQYSDNQWNTLMYDIMTFFRTKIRRLDGWTKDNRWRPIW